MRPSEERPRNEIERVAIEKMERVLGHERAQQLYLRLVVDARRPLETPQDLLRLSEAMTALGGIEGAVGAMLGVAAVIRGAGG